MQSTELPRSTFQVQYTTKCNNFFCVISLAEYINAKLYEKGCDEIDDLEKYIPNDIEVKHAVEAWKVACQKSEDYHQRMQP